MGTKSLVRWVRRSPRYFFALLTMGAAAYALDKWFFLGVAASKWIGLPDYAALMRETQNQSRNWGIAALILEALTLDVLVLPGNSGKDDVHTGDLTPLTARSESRSANDYIAQFAIRTVLCILGTIAFAVLNPLVASLFSR